MTPSGDHDSDTGNRVIVNLGLNLTRRRKRATGHGLHQLCPAITIYSMTRRLRPLLVPHWWIAVSCCLCLSLSSARPSDESRPSPSPHPVLPKRFSQDDSLVLHPPGDL